MPRKSIARVAMDSGASPLTLIDWLENGVPVDALETWAALSPGKKRVSRAPRKKAPTRKGSKKKTGRAAKKTGGVKKKPRRQKKSLPKSAADRPKLPSRGPSRPATTPSRPPRPIPAPPPRKKKRAPPTSKKKPPRKKPLKKKKRPSAPPVKKRRRRRIERKPRPPRQTRAQQALAWWTDSIPQKDALAVAQELGIDNPRARLREWLRDGLPWEVLDNWARRKPWAQDAKLIGETALRFLEAREKGWREVTNKDWRAVKKAVKERWGEREARIAFDWAVDEYELEDYIIDYDALWET